MNYSVKALSRSNEQGVIDSGENKITFGVSKESMLPTPADLLVSAFAACCLKNVERFSEFMHYTYKTAEIRVEATRKEKPPMIDTISFLLTIKTSDKTINTDLLLRNLQKFGTIYNTLSVACDIKGDVKIEKV